MAVRLSALCTSCPLAPGRFLVLIYVRGWIDPRAIVRLEGLGQSKNPVTLPEINVFGHGFVQKSFLYDLVNVCVSPSFFMGIVRCKTNLFLQLQTFLVRDNFWIITLFYSFTHWPKCHDFVLELKNISLPLLMVPEYGIRKLWLEQFTTFDIPFHCSLFLLSA
jgi:hypothetical protein